MAFLSSFRFRLIALICLFLIPISVQNYLYWSQSVDQITSANKEISGTDDLRDVFNERLSVKARPSTIDSVDEALRKLSAINDDSGIILDPDQDTFYLGDIVATKVPQMVRHQVWFDVTAKHDAQLTQKDNLQLAIELDRFVEETKAIMNEFKKRFRAMLMVYLHLPCKINCRHGRVRQVLCKASCSVSPRKERNRTSRQLCKTLQL